MAFWSASLKASIIFSSDFLDFALSFRKKILFLPGSWFYILFLTVPCFLLVYLTPIQGFSDDNYVGFAFTTCLTFIQYIWLILLELTKRTSFEYLYRLILLSSFLFLYLTFFFFSLSVTTWYWIFIGWRHYWSQLLFQSFLRYFYYILGWVQSDYHLIGFQKRFLIY